VVDQGDVWLVVPVYNEATVVADVVREAAKTFPNVVCVDDGSRDGSADQVRLTGAHLVRHPVNLGQGAAIQTGVEYARARPGARYFVTFDADGQHRVEDAERMVQRLRDEPLDIVVGTRFHGDTAHIPAMRRFALKAVVALSPALRRLNLTDAHNGLRAFTGKVAGGMNITLNGMGHASQIVQMVIQEGWRLAEEPVTIRYTEYSMAKGQSLLNGVNIVFDTVLRTNARR
jgi:glycosyltransferase involved in cell wall biosynthesis